jgi:hypothetical protein
MGMFWLTAGIMSLRWGADGERARRASVVASIVGIVAGALVLARIFIVEVLGESIVAVVLGSLVVLIGLVHVFEGFRTGVDGQRQRSWTSTLLGLFEIGLVLLREALRKRKAAQSRMRLKRQSQG